MGFAKVRINQVQLARALKRDLKRTTKEIKKTLNKFGFFMRTRMDARFGGELSGPFKRNPTGPALRGRLRVRTGALRRSVGHVVKSDGKNLSLLLFVGDAVTGKYAAIQEFGGTIRGKPWLTVPLPDNLTPTGRTRFSDVRSTPGAFFARSKAGNIIVGRKTEGGVEWMWILKRSVKIQPRLGFVKTFEQSRTDLNKLLNAAIQRALRRGA